MPRQLNQLKPLFVARTREIGYHADGGGLYLRVTQSGEEHFRRSWFFRFTRSGVSREMGLGSATVVGLAEARQKRDEARKLIAAGKDPLTERRTAQAAESPMRWGDLVDEYISDVVAPDKKDTGRRKSKGSAHQWAQCLRDHGPDRNLLVREVTRDVVLSCLKPIWAGKTETATRLRQRMESVLGYAETKGYRNGENPALRSAILKLLPKAARLREESASNFEAIPYAELPHFLEELRERVAPAARALELLIYTATRTNEVVRGFEWSELRGDVWRIPPHRMKGRRGKRAKEAHEIPLVAEARAIFDSLDRDNPRPLDLSENAMLYLIYRMNYTFTVHGMRSAFRDWAGEETDFPREAVELCLAHAIKDKTEAAYRRRYMLDKRRQIMEAWALFLAGKEFPRRLRYED